MVAENRKVNTHWVLGNKLTHTGVAVTGTFNRKRLAGGGGGGGGGRDKTRLFYCQASGP